MVKIENEINLQVTFSKRQADLFKKASELSTLCGAESVVVVFSAGQKPHSYGHPNVKTVAVNPNRSPNSRNESHQLQRAAHGDAIMHHRNQEVGIWEAQLKQEKERRKANENLRTAPQCHRWCSTNINDLNYQQLDELKRSIMNFKQNFETKIQDATSLENSYAHGLDNTNIQGPGDQLFAEFYGSNAPSMVPGGSSNIPPTQFVGGVGTSNPMVNASPSVSFLSGYARFYTTTDNNLRFTCPYNYGSFSEIVGPGVSGGSSVVKTEGNAVQ